MYVDKVRRQELKSKLQRSGIRVSVLEQLSIRELEELVKVVDDLATEPEQGKKAQDQKRLLLSATDKKILKALLTSSGATSSLMLSRELDIPLSTVQRRRKKLESTFLEFYYQPKVEKLDWRVALVFVSMDSGAANTVGNQLLSWQDSVVYVARTIGGDAIDLVVQVVFQDNKGLLEICDRIKAIPGVKNLFWTEMVAMMGKNTACFETMIDSI